MLALVLQVSPDEIAAGEELVSLICDLESSVRKDVEFILFTRKDVEFSDTKRLMARLETKFSRAKHVECWDFATGWPHGSNTMWCSLIRQMFHAERMDEIAADGFLSFECDCIPVQRDWISLLSRAWDEAKTKYEVLGHFHPDATNPTHVNGNAIFATDFWWKHQELLGSHGLQPWDVAFARTILPVAADCALIDQWYRLPSFTQKDWDRISKTHCVLFHGVKSGDGRRIAREKLIDVAKHKSSHQR